MGALIAAVASMKIFAGSEVSIFTLEKAYSAGVTPEQSQTLINRAALAEFMRGLGFVPLIATTALATGVYAVAGFTFVYAVGYLAESDGCSGIRRSGYFGGSLAASFDRQMVGALPVGT